MVQKGWVSIEMPGRPEAEQNQTHEEVDKGVDAQDVGCVLKYARCVSKSKFPVVRATKGSCEVAAHLYCW